MWEGTSNKIVKDKKMYLFAYGKNICIYMHLDHKMKYTILDTYRPIHKFTRTKTNRHKKFDIHILNTIIFTFRHIN